MQYLVQWRTKENIKTLSEIPKLTEKYFLTRKYIKRNIYIYIFSYFCIETEEIKYNE